jgi:uncharacterized OB-fold protein
VSAPVTELRTPLELDFTVTAGVQLTRFLTALLEGRVVGARCGVCARVYVPPRGACPTCAVPAAEPLLELADTGTVTTFCVVNIPFEGQKLVPPYVCATVVLDGADVPVFHLIGGVTPAEVRVGLRVKARWLPPEARTPSLTCIEFFEPTGEPDAAPETIAGHI